MYAFDEQTIQYTEDILGVKCFLLRLPNLSTNQNVPVCQCYFISLLFDFGIVDHENVNSSINPI